MEEVATLLASILLSPFLNIITIYIVVIYFKEKEMNLMLRKANVLIPFPK